MTLLRLFLFLKKSKTSTTTTTNTPNDPVRRLLFCARSGWWSPCPL